MCLIVFKSASNQVFSNTYFKNMISRNDDGLGIMFRENGRVIVEKSVGSGEDKVKLFLKHRDRQSWAMHARFKTHGAIDINNCHPYKIMSIDDGDPVDLYMMHNGVISNAPDVRPLMSDTWNYVEYILKPMIKGMGVDTFWDNDHINQMVADHIGKTNKFLFMRSDEHDTPVLILNSKSGVERNGLWLSNSYSVDGASTGYSFRSANPANNTTPSGHSYTHSYTPSKSYAEKQAEIARKLEEEHASAPFSGGQTSHKVVSIGPKQQAAIERKKQTADAIRPDYLADPENLHDLGIQLQVLRTMKDEEVLAYMESNGADIADIIIGLYDKNTMDFVTICDLIHHRPQDILKLLREMTTRTYNNKKQA